MFTVREHQAATLRWWYSQRKYIDMNPPYQRRGGVWRAKDKAYLVDSMLNRYDIPKFYLADFTFGNSPLNVASKQYAVIDGKQRFEAIFDFFEGRIVLDEDFIYEDDPSLALAGLGYKDLVENHPEVADRFDNFNLSVMSVITDEDGKINDLFVRLNRSRPLTGAENRNAMKGPIPPLIRTISDHSFFRTKVKFATDREQDRNVAAKLLLIEFRGRFVDVKKAQLDRFVREAVKTDSPSESTLTEHESAEGDGTQDVEDAEEALAQDGVLADAPVSAFESAANRVQEVLDAMDEIFVDKDPLLSSQGPVTVYYWLVRHLPSNQHPRLRTFLLGFEASRRANRDSAAHPGNVVDSELTRYDNLDRSTNDVGSLEGRYDILLKRFAETGQTAAASSTGNA